MKALVVLALSYGFIAGVSPGPLLAMVISQTLERGLWAGYLIAFIPIIFEPILSVSILLLVKDLPPGLFQGMSVLGGLILFGIGLQTLINKPGTPITDPQSSLKVNRSEFFSVLGRGIALQLFNPHPFLFWISVASPILHRTYLTQGALAVALFMLVFYLVLTVTKLSIATLVSRSRRFLHGILYRRVIQSTGALLMGLGIQSIVSGLSSFEIIKVFLKICR